MMDNDNTSFKSGSITTTAAAKTVENNNNNNNNDDQIIIKIEANLRNMGKSLSCPLCLSTLRKPVILPCLHAFCQDCISKHITTIQQAKAKSSRNICCPICKDSCSKRSMVRSTQLEELARKYKEAVRSFGFAPVIYDKNQNVGMTQIEEEVSFSIDDSPMVMNHKLKSTQEYDNNNNNNKHNGEGRKVQSKSKRKQNNNVHLDEELQVLKKKKTLPPTVRECHEHLEVSRAVHNALKRVMNEEEEEEENNHNDDTNSKTKINDEGVDENVTTTITTTATIATTSDNDTTITESTTSTKSTKMTIQEMERQNQRKKLRTLLEDQEKVVKVDEAAIVKAASYTYKKRKSMDEKRKSHSSNIVVDDDDDNNNNDNSDMIVIDESDGQDQKEDEKITSASNSNTSKDIEGVVIPIISQRQSNNQSNTANISDITTLSATTTTATNDNLNIASPGTSNILKRAEEAISDGQKLLDLPLTQTQQVFFSASGEESQQQQYSIDNDEDDNMHKKTKKSEKDTIIMTSQEEYEASMDEIRENEVADRSMEEIIDDDHPDQIIDSVFGGATSITTTTTTTTTTSKRIQTSQMSDKYFSASSQNLTSTNGDEVDTKSEGKESSSVFTVGTIVNVQARTWPGVNKPGGTARITKIHSQCKGNNIRYDVAYVLGGKEKMVDDAFVSLPKHNNDEDDGTNNDGERNQKKESQAGSNIKSTDVSRKSRRVGERKKVEKWVEEIDAKLEEEQEKKKNAKCGARSRRSSAQSQEEVTEQKDSTQTSSKTSKKRKRASNQNRDEDIPSTYKRKSSSNAEEASKADEKKNDYTLSQLKKLALERYNKLLFEGDVKVINITTSSLSEMDEKLVKDLCKKLSSKKVKIKLLNDFNAKKSSVCITTPSEKSPIVSKLRTVKAMRATLAAVPILSPAWLSFCIDQNSLKAPKENMYIQTLPSKEEVYMKSIAENSIRKETAHGGVFAVAAQYQEESNKKQSFYLFENLYIHLCGGGWKKSPAKTKDVNLLLKEGGANVLSSASVVTKTLTKGLGTGSTFVLLCDGNINSTNSAFPANLKHAIENTIDDKTSSVLVVNSKWLFDCISCAEILGSEHYQPLGTLVKKLWQKTQ